MEIIELNLENIEKQHICCALSSNNDSQVISKKEWLKKEMKNGLVFKKMNVRGKCFIEYMPLENAWISVSGEDLMYINCLWVSGKFQHQGYARELLESCIQDSIQKQRKGVVILSSKKKSPFVMDYSFLKFFSFYEVDQWNQYVLMFLPLDENIPHPHFDIKQMDEDGFVLYYSHQCPFNIKYVALLKKYCDKHHIPLKCIHLKSKEEAKKAPTPLTTYSLFYNKQFITREVLTVQKYEKFRRKYDEQD